MVIQCAASQQPQTLAHALADSPAGLLGWNASCWARVWTTIRDHQYAVHWFTGTAGSAIRHYFEEDKAATPGEPSTVPLALCGVHRRFPRNPAVRRTRPQHRVVADTRSAQPLPASRRGGSHGRRDHRVLRRTPERMIRPGAGGEHAVIAARRRTIRDRLTSDRVRSARSDTPDRNRAMPRRAHLRRRVRSRRASAPPI